jgi:gag-polypeptide of LTR copia-type
MAIGHLTCRVNPSIQQELDSLPTASFADDYWTHLSTCYGTAMPSSIYKDFKKTLNIRLNPSQHATQQIDCMVTAFQHLTAASIIIPPQIQAMILLSALPQKWEMLVSIVTQQHVLMTIQLSHVRDAILAQYELENVCSSGKGKQQHANKLSAVKQKHSNQSFSNQESGGSQQKLEDHPKCQHGGRRKGKKKEQQGHAYTVQVSHIAKVASLEAPTTATIALPGPSGLQKRTVSMEKPKVWTPGPYKALNAALDKVQEDGVMPTIEMVKTLEQCITKQYEEGPWLKGNYTLGEEFDEDKDIDMSVMPPSTEGQEDWVFEEASPASPSDEPLDWGSNEDLEECVVLPFLYPMFTKPPASL